MPWVGQAFQGSTTLQWLSQIIFKFSIKNPLNIYYICWYVLIVTWYWLIRNQYILLWSSFCKFEYFIGKHCWQTERVYWSATASETTKIIGQYSDQPWRSWSFVRYCSRRYGKHLFWRRNIFSQYLEWSYRSCVTKLSTEPSIKIYNVLISITPRLIIKGCWQENR